jgi:hypothetical protein
VSPDDSAADVLAELQRKTRSRQASDMSVYIDEENRNEAPAFDDSDRRRESAAGDL